eukprot:5127634-Amphidinium_carterae.1
MFTLRLDVTVLFPNGFYLGAMHVPIVIPFNGVYHSDALVVESWTGDFTGGASACATGVALHHYCRQHHGSRLPPCAGACV